MRKYAGADIDDGLWALGYRVYFLCVFGFMAREKTLTSFSLLTSDFGPRGGIPDGLPDVEFRLDVGNTVRPSGGKNYLVASGTAALIPKP